MSSAASPRPSAADAGAQSLRALLSLRLGRIALPLIAGHLLALVPFAISRLLSPDLAGHGFDLGAIVGHSGVPGGAGPSGLYGWDADSYARIAAQGYPGPGDTLNQHLEAFLPLYPLLVRTVMVTGLSAAWSGLIVSLVAEAVALVAIDLLVLAERDSSAARFAVWFTALAPFGVFLSVVYTESTFIAAAALSLYYARRGSLAAASLAATVASATRITGLVLAPVILFEWVRRTTPWRRLPSLRELALLPLFALPAAPFLLFSVYLGVHSGDINGFHHAQAGSSFNHDVASPWTGFWTTWHSMTGAAESAAQASDPSAAASAAENYQIWFREVVFGIAGLIICVVAWLDRRFPRSLALYCSLVWLVSTSISFWLSVPRYMLALFPITILIADLTESSKWLRPMLAVTAGVILTWSGWLYGTGHWVA